MSACPSDRASSAASEVAWRTLPTRSSFKVSQEAPLETLLQGDGLAQLGAVMAVDADGVLRGIVTADQVRRALRPKPA